MAIEHSLTRLEETTSLFLYIYIYIYIYTFMYMYVYVCDIMLICSKCTIAFQANCTFILHSRECKLKDVIDPLKVKFCNVKYTKTWRLSVKNKFMQQVSTLIVKLLIN